MSNNIIEIMVWTKAIDKLPSLFKEVEWRNGDIALGKYSPIDIYHKAGANIQFYEWLDESAVASKEQGEEKTFDTLRVEQHKRRMELEKENEVLKVAIAQFKEVRSFFRKGSPLSERMDKIIQDHNL